MKSLLALFFSLFLAASSAQAGSDKFSLPRDMQKLLPDRADAVLALSSFQDLDDLWQDLLPPEVHFETDDHSLIPFFQSLLKGFSDLVDRERPLLVVANFQSPLGPDPLKVSFLLPLKDPDTDLAYIPGFEKYLLLKEGGYALATTNTSLTPGNHPRKWTRRLPGSVALLDLDLDHIIEVLQPVINMTMQEARNSDPAPLTSEDMEVFLQALGKILESSAGLQLSLGRDHGLITKDLVYRTKPDSPLAPAPQPSFKQALALTRFLPGGEDLISVLAYDQSSLVRAFSDFSILMLHNDLRKMDAEDSDEYSQWYAELLNNQDLNSLPTALTLRLEKSNSSLQSIIQSPAAEVDFQRLAHLLDLTGKAGLGLDLQRQAVEPIAGVDIIDWSLVWDHDQVLANFNQPIGFGDDMPMTEDELTGLLHLAPEHWYLAWTGDYILSCGGNDPQLMGELIRRIAEKGGAVDPRLSRARKQRGDDLQVATTGNLLAVIQMIQEMAEESEDIPNLTWPTGHPSPFLATLEINETDYRVHLEIKMAAVRDLLSTLAAIEE